MRGRSQKLTEDEARRALHELGLSPLDFQRIHAAPSYDLKCRHLDGLKRAAKKGYRKAARRFHPDLQGDDEKKAELFRLVTESYRQIEQLKVRPPRPIARPVRVVLTFTPGFRGASAPRRAGTASFFDSSNAATDATTTASTYEIFRRIHRRV